MEVAAFLSDKAASVAVVGRSDVPYQFSLGPDIGRMTMQVRKFLWFFSVHFAVKASIHPKHFFFKRCWRRKMWDSTWIMVWLKYKGRMERWDWTEHKSIMEVFELFFFFFCHDTFVFVGQKGYTAKWWHVASRCCNCRNW